MDILLKIKPEHHIKYVSIADKISPFAKCLTISLQDIPEENYLTYHSGKPCSQIYTHLTR
jgi:hypothetical protein